MIVKLLRGETKLVKEDRPPEGNPVLWESASIDQSNSRIVRVFNGINKIIYQADEPRYAEISKKVRERFPALAPGKICFRCFFRERIELTTKDYGGINLLDRQKKCVFWESISIRADDGKIVHVVSGHSRREYPTEHPDYAQVEKKVLADYPDLSSGRICKYFRYSDGSEKVEITKLD